MHTSFFAQFYHLLSNYFLSKEKSCQVTFSHFVSSKYVVDKFFQLPICIKKTMPHHTYQYGVDTAFFIIDLKFHSRFYIFSVTLSLVRARARDASLCLYSFRLSFCLSLSSALIFASLALTLSISSGFSAESTIRTTRLFTI